MLWCLCLIGLVFFFFFSSLFPKFFMIVHSFTFCQHPLHNTIPKPESPQPPLQTSSIQTSRTCFWVAILVLVAVVEAFEFDAQGGFNVRLEMRQARRRSKEVARKSRRGVAGDGVVVGVRNVSDKKPDPINKYQIWFGSFRGVVTCCFDRTAWAQPRTSQWTSILRKHICLRYLFPS